MVPENKPIRSLSLPAEERFPRLVQITEPWRPTRAAPEELPEEPGIPVSHYFWVLRPHWWRILVFITLAVAATAIVSKRITPIYESTATIDVDRQTPPGIIGQEAQRAAGNDADQFLATQMKLIQSDAVLRPVVDQYRLRDVEPENFDSFRGSATAAADAPVRLKRLAVVRPPNTYLLLISYRSTNPQLAADVTNAVARSYLEHTYNIRIRASASLSSFMERQLEDLKAKMERSSTALARLEKELNVINPEEKTSILSARLLQLNTEYTNAQADRVRKEAAYRSTQSGTLEAAQVSSQGEALKKLTERLDEAQEKFAEVETHYGANHPEHKKASAYLAELERQVESARENIGVRVRTQFTEAVSRETMLGQAVSDTKREFDRVNARSFEYQNLKREAEADKTLYEELVRKIKEAGINAGFQNSSIRIADTARPALEPVFPHIRLNIGLAFLLSTLLAVGAVLISDALNTTVRDSEQLARFMKVEVVGHLPLVKEWKNRRLPTLTNTESVTPPFGRAPEPTLSSFDEAVRTLRNSILLADFDRRLRSLMVTSAAPGEGKSTIAANLAAAHAQHGSRTLLVDSDLRRPSQHWRFNLHNENGLSPALKGEESWTEGVTPIPAIPNLYVLPAGPPSRRAADLIGSRLGDILEAAVKQYDLVVVDSPPLLGFPETLQMAASADGVLVVALSGQTPRKALAACIATLDRLRANVVGVAMNLIRDDAGHRQYYYSHAKYYRNGEDA